ncbi:MAG: hypothetical protein ACP5QA_00040 [Phycisphaerae bacterium]
MVWITKPATFDDDLKNPPYPGKPRESAIALANNKIGTAVLGADDARALEELVKDQAEGQLRVTWVLHDSSVD